MGVPDVWSVYLTVEDVNKTLESVPGHGGQVIVPAMQVGEAGTMAVALDPAGAAIGLWVPKRTKRRKASMAISCLIAAFVVWRGPDEDRLEHAMFADRRCKLDERLRFEDDGRPLRSRC